MLYCEELNKQLVLRVRSDLVPFAAILIDQKGIVYVTQWLRSGPFAAALILLPSLMKPNNKGPG